MATGPNPFGLPIPNPNPLTKNLPVKKPATRHGHDFLPEPVPESTTEAAALHAPPAGERAARRASVRPGGRASSRRGACAAAGHA